MIRESVRSLLILIFIANLLDAEILQRSYRDNATDFISNAGYGFQVHQITTSDGYILKIHRVLPRKLSSLPTPSKPGCPTRPAIFLMHGFTSCSMEMIFLGAGKSLAYELVDNGYDVFLGNFRGGYFTETHTTLSTNDSKFWDFTLHELATIDIAESIDYVRLQTGSKKIFYYGDSLGTTEIMILLAEKPHYNDKLIQVSLIGTTVWVGNERDDLLSRLLTDDNILSCTTFIEFGGLVDLIIRYDNANCIKKTTKTPDCALIRTFKEHILIWVDNGRLVDPAFPGISKFVSPRLSTKMVRHILQIRLTRSFRKYVSRFFDQPIYYNLSNVRVPIRIQRGEKDTIMTKVDYDAFLAKIRSSNATTHLVSKFGHTEMVFGLNANKKVFKDIVASMNYERRKYYGSGGACAAVRKLGNKG